MNRRLRTFLLLGLALLLLVKNSFTQERLNRQRADLGLTRLPPLENAPPMLAFTTVALGGFRGLMANYLWVRAANLQNEGKYFEMLSLANWITKLQPSFATVWANQAWNMTYNISRLFKDPVERWRWIQSGIELLRDEGLRYNPQEPLLYRELAWFFQDKIGKSVDEHHMFYKEAWAAEMVRLIGARPDFAELLDPKTDEARARVKILREKYKLDPAGMKQVDEHYGPFDWRLPEAQAVYWADVGLKKSRREDLIVLRRVIWQSMQLSFQRGRLIENRADKKIEFGPNLPLAPKTNQAYVEMMQQDPERRDYISKGHRIFLKDAVYFFYTHARMKDSAIWFQVLRDNYPDEVKPGQTLDDFAIARVTAAVEKSSVHKTKSIIEGLFVTFFYNLALGEDDQANGSALLASAVWQHYQASLTAAQIKAVGLPPLNELQQAALDQCLNGQGRFSPELAAQLRSRLGLAAPDKSKPPARPQ